MNAPMESTLQHPLRVAAAVAQACDAIAPTWPLDRFIAVNPFWGWVGQTLPQAAARLGLYTGTRLTSTGEAPAKLPLLADGLGATELLTHQISQHCAAFFDHTQARWQPAREGGLYGSWRRQIVADRGLPWRRGRGWLIARVAALPDDAAALVADALPALGIQEPGHAPYLTALLLSVNGWAAWCAYERWQARLAGSEDPALLQELLAVRLAWEWLLHDDAEPSQRPGGWARAWNEAEAAVERLAAAQQADWQRQRELETAYQQPLAAALAAAPRAEDRVPAVQAVFCIDVRSEVFRRALEAADPGVQTHGFAGFFGLPISYAPAGSTLQRPQLPGLLAPALQASEPPLAQVLVARRRHALQWRQRWADLRGSAASGFSFVEACGLAYAPRLLAACWPGTTPPPRWEDTGLPKAARGAAPRLPIEGDAAVQLAQRVLTAMGLVRNFAPLVLLAGHGSQSANNAHAAGLDCGACGGQTGEVNARALAELLNRPAVREGLVPRGMQIPPATRFVPALHNTTTDDVTLFDTEGAPEDRLQLLQAALQQAGQRARAERAPSLGLAAGGDDALATAVRRRANDWSETRPEWGLAGNAAFIAAPRSRTRHVKLDGRAFLHDYDATLDADGSVLELIMTAPMVVAHWINFQYLASTLDNRRWGSGDKVLHNVVGGTLGVFEGNGGDLRIGLPLQSLHDGTRWRHEALRLSVYIEAPRAAIERVIARHDVVRQLVQHGWLHLFCIEGSSVQAVGGL